VAVDSRKAHRHEDAAVDSVVAQEGVLLGQSVDLLEATAAVAGELFEGGQPV
jgi:hypothetical protein